MPVNKQTIRYDTLVQNAMRGVIRRVLEIARDEGLPGDHHFYIVFDTQAQNVNISDRLKQRYPSEMTIVLQHQFWDLFISDTEFEVKLSFSGISERLVVPFAAIKAFVDPSVPYGFQLETDHSVEPSMFGSEFYSGMPNVPQTVSSADHDGSLRSLAPAESVNPAVPSISESDIEFDEDEFLDELEEEETGKIITIDFSRKNQD